MAATKVEILRNDNYLLKWECLEQAAEPWGNGSLLDSLDPVDEHIEEFLLHLEDNLIS